MQQSKASKKNALHSAGYKLICGYCRIYFQETVDMYNDNKTILSWIKNSSVVTKSRYQKFIPTNIKLLILDQYRSLAPYFCATTSINRSFKVCTFGEYQSGKTCIVNRLVSNTFCKEYKRTIGATFSTKTIHIAPNHVIKLEIWDIGGRQQHHRPLSPLYLRGAHLVLLIFDICNCQSFTDAKYRYKEVMTQFYCAEDVVIYLIGNKADLRSKRKSVSTKEILKWAHENNLPYWEISACDGTNITELFDDISCKLCQYAINHLNKEKQQVVLETVDDTSSDKYCSLS
eukprot:4744_1